MQQITIQSFLNLIGEETCGEFASNKIESSDMRYEILSYKEKEEQITKALKILDENEFSITGDITKWHRGWEEVLSEFKKTKSVDNLAAKFSTTRGKELILRFYGEYIRANSKLFHQNLYTAFHYWAIEKYFKNAIEIFDFGCGTGENIKHIGDILPNTKLHGLDWVEESANIVNLLKENFEINARGHKFDMFNPDYSLNMPLGSVVYTSESLEQIGNNFHPFLNFLLEKKPSIVVNFEPIIEFYDDAILLDYLALKYHTQRKYLGKYYTELVNLQNQSRIRILKHHRIQYGGLNHDSSIIVWEIL